MSARTGRLKSSEDDFGSDEDDDNSEVLKTSGKNNNAIDNFLQSKASLSDVYLKLNQKEIVSATIFGTRSGSFTDAVGDMLT